MITEEGFTELVRTRDNLRDHVENLADKQPWDNKAMFAEVLDTLNWVTSDAT